MNKDQKNQRFGQLIYVSAISLVIGGLTGGLAGFFTAGIASGSLTDWLTNPLGFGKIANTANQTVDSNANQPTANGSLSEEELTTRAVAKVSPAVVSIIVTKELQQFYNSTGPGFPFDDFFGFPFSFNEPQSVPGPKEKQEVGGGTGFIISKDGLILTNKHVVSDTEAEYSVVLNDGQKYDAKVVARDPLNDLAFLKIEADNLPMAELGDSGKVQIGQTVIAIGYALGEYSNSVTKGIISGLGREIVAGGAGSSEKLEGVIQTDAAINPGNSGGPLINLYGQVIGINTAINQQGQLIGFAIPVNSAKNQIQSVKKEGKIVRPYLGVRYIMLNEEIAKKNSITVNYGALILRGENQGELAVVPGSPADKAGLEENDIILEMNSVKLDEKNTLAQEIAKHQPGETVTLKILHDGEEKTITVILDEFKE